MSEAVAPIDVSQNTTTAGEQATAGIEEKFSSLLSSLPEELRGNVNIGRHKNFESLAKEYAGSQALIGKKGIILPGEDQADIARFLRELGRPESPADYDRKDFTPPESINWSEQIEEKLTGLLHASGVTQGQFEKLIPGYAALQEQEYEAMQQAVTAHQQEQVALLKSELGASYDQKMNLASRAIQNIFGEEKGEIFLHSVLPDGTKLGNNNEFIKGMMTISEMFKDDSLVRDATSGIPMAKTPAEAKREISAKNSDTEFMERYLNPKATGHAEANAEMDALYAQAHPSQSQ